jgi:hypothetical protein
MKLPYKEKLFKLNQNLIYPAMFGAFFVLFFQNYFNELEQSDRFLQVDFVFFITLLIYYLFSYLVNESIEEFKIYNIATFISDIIEVVAMFFILSKLIEISRTGISIINEFYLLAIWIPISNFIWNFSLKTSGKVYYLYNFIMLILLLTMGYWGCKFFVLNYVFAVIAIIILIKYLFQLIIRDNQFYE